MPPENAGEASDTCPRYLRGCDPLQEQAGEFPSHHFAFTATGSDLEQAVIVLRERGVPTRGPVFHGWVPGTSLYFEDLDGHELELFAPST
jgi:catechol-2,3-dioxygenase